MSEDEEDPRPPLDDVGFNDAGAWGYCERCAFDVGVKDGKRLPHRRYRNLAVGESSDLCSGSYDAPVMDSPDEAKPWETVNLRKTWRQERDSKLARLERLRRRREAEENDCGD